MRVRLLGVLMLLGSMVLPAAPVRYPGPQARAASQSPIPSAQFSDESAPSLVPGTVPVDDTIAAAVLQVLHDAHDSAAGTAYYAISDIRSIGAWHFVSVVGLESVSPALSWRLEDAIWTGLVLLHRPQDGPWVGAVEGTERYSRLLAEIPDSIIEPQARRELDPTQRTRVPAESYLFPWELGTSMYYGVLGVHPAGFAGVVGGDWKAVDFLSDADTSAGHAPNRLLASAPGTISYVCDDGTSLAIRIGDLLYVHLLYNSTLTIGHYFDQGDELGQLKTGSFSDVCGYASQGSGWFHVHWGFPDTGSFQAGGWTLDFSDQLWHWGGETRDTGDWLLADMGEEAPPTGTTGRASVASDGTEGNDNSEHPALSAGGRFVAFVSSADNLVAGDDNDTTDVFLHDRWTGATERISIAGSGQEGNNPSDWPAVSPDGRYVAFQSAADNLVVDDDNGVTDIFLRDRSAGTTERVSISSAGLEAQGSSTNPAVSANGRYVAFQSHADNLVSGDDNESSDVFVHDRVTGQTERASVSSAAAPGDDDSESPSISADGRYVAFQSHADNLVTGFTNTHADVFVHDRVTVETELVSVALDVGGANGPSGSPSISADGRYVAFSSDASDLVTGDDNGFEDIFVCDRVLENTTLISVSRYGTQGNDHSWAPSISADGRTVVFASFASNLVSGDGNGVNDIYLHDRASGTTERVSYSTAGEGGNDSSVVPSISTDGRLIAFSSWSDMLASGDENSAEDIFIRDRDGGYPYSVSGQVRHPNGLAASGVELRTDSGAATTSSSEGDYAFSFDIDRTYTLTPTRPGLVFSPATRIVRVPPDAVGRSFMMLSPPVSTTLSTGVNASLAYTDTQELVTTLSIPAGAVTETLTLTLTPTYFSHTAGYAFTGHAFELAVSRDGAPQPGFTFSLPVTITIPYSADDLRLIYNEEGLLLMTGPRAPGADAAGTCEPALPYQRDTVGQVLALPICRTGSFGLFGPTHQAMLPLVSRNR